MSESKPRSIAEAWRSYDARVLPAVAGEVQRMETRKAFYAGAMVLFNILLHGVSDGDEMTEEDDALYDGLQRELSDFFDEATKHAAEARARRGHR
jgi:hypothetical protein